MARRRDASRKLGKAVVPGGPVKGGSGGPGVLGRVRGPRDLKGLDDAELERLAAEIRSFLVTSVSKTGGHLGPNLGVVELTIAIHRVFDSPGDTIVFDTGHQAYVHKILTGRQDFSELRKRGGLSGYPSRAESVHDVVESSHASAGLSWAAGIAAARRLTGQADHFTVVVVGDGALTGGMAWEALNNIAAVRNSRLVIVVNDNGRSYAPTIGGLARHLAGLRTDERYERLLDWGRRFLRAHGRPGRFTYDALHGLKKGIKDVVAPQVLFEDLGIKYIGTIDGHDIGAMRGALERAKRFGGPVIVHAVTEKGRGYSPAEDDLADHFHAVGRIHPETGLPLVPSGFGWTGVFADEVVRLARKQPRVVAITAAMLEPVGFAPFAAEFPDRVFDVGIAEQHAVTTAAGMAYAGLHPVVAVYSTFFSRAFDQLLMDVALHQEAVTFVLDRAGLTGDDGASHNGQWDLALARLVPGLRVAAPRDGVRLRQLLGEAIGDDAGPTLVRYPKGQVPDACEALASVDGIDILAEAADAGIRLLIVACGPCARTGLEVARLLGLGEGVSATVVDPRWVLPVNQALVPMVAGHDAVVVIEDGLASGGVGDAVAQALREAGLTMPIRTFGIPRRFLAQATREELSEELGLRAQDIVTTVLASHSAAVVET